MLNSEVTEIQAAMDFEPSHPGIDDMVYVILKFVSGTRGVITSGIRIPRPTTILFLWQQGQDHVQGHRGIAAARHRELILTDSSISTATSYPVAYPSLVKSISAIEAFNDWITGASSPISPQPTGLKW